MNYVQVQMFMVEQKLFCVSARYNDVTTEVWKWKFTA